MKIKALRNVRLTLRSGRCFLQKGDELPKDYISIEPEEIKQLSSNPAFEVIKEPKSETKKKVKNEV